MNQNQPTPTQATDMPLTPTMPNMIPNDNLSQQSAPTSLAGGLDQSTPAYDTMAANLTQPTVGNPTTDITSASENMQPVVSEPAQEPALSSMSNLNSQPLVNDMLNDVPLTNNVPTQTQETNSPVSVDFPVQTPLTDIMDTQIDAPQTEMYNATQVSDTPMNQPNIETMSNNIQSETPLQVENSIPENSTPIATQVEDTFMPFSSEMPMDNSTLVNTVSSSDTPAIGQNADVFAPIPVSADDIKPKKAGSKKKFFVLFFLLFIVVSLGAGAFFGLNYLKTKFDPTFSPIFEDYLLSPAEQLNARISPMLVELKALSQKTSEVESKDQYEKLSKQLDILNDYLKSGEFTLIASVEDTKNDSTTTMSADLALDISNLSDAKVKGNLSYVMEVDGEEMKLSGELAFTDGELFGKLDSFDADTVDYGIDTFKGKWIALDFSMLSSLGFNNSLNLDLSYSDEDEKKLFSTDVINSIKLAGNEVVDGETVKCYSMIVPNDIGTIVPVNGNTSDMNVNVKLCFTKQTNVLKRIEVSGEEDNQKVFQQIDFNLNVDVEVNKPEDAMTLEELMKTQYEMTDNTLLEDSEI